MSWSLANLLGGSVGAAADGVSKAIDRFVETDEEEKAAALLAAKMKQDPHKWQAEINKVTAGHRSMFVAGARPFILWVCGFALAWGWLARPIIESTLVIVVSMGGVGKLDADTLKVIMENLPQIEVAESLGLATMMLGLGGMRSYEKKEGLTG